MDKAKKMLSEIYYNEQEDILFTGIGIAFQKRKTEQFKLNTACAMLEKVLSTLR